MKEVYNLEGELTSVSIDTPVRTVNGKNYLLSPVEESELAARQTTYDADAPARALKAVLSERCKEYGSPEAQLEYITENGLTAWQTKVTEIKARHPKPE